MRNHIRLREVARRTEPVLEGFVKAQIDVHLLITRAIKRAHGRLAGATGRRCGAPKKHQARVLVRAAPLAKNVLPHVFGIGQNGGDKTRHLVVRRGAVGRRLRLNLCGRPPAAKQAQNGQRVDAKHPAPHQGHHDGADANAAPAKNRRSTAAAPIAAVLHIV